MLVGGVERPDRVTMKQAAAELQISVLDLRWGLSEGKFPIGEWRFCAGGKKRHFIVYRKQLDEEKKRRGIST